MARTCSLFFAILCLLGFGVTGAVADPAPGTAADPEAVVDARRTDPLGRFVLLEAPYFLLAYTEYNPGTCELISPGTMSTALAPKHGKIEYTVETLPIDGGPCAGKKFPFSVARYTWTDHTPDKAVDIFKVEWKTPDGKFDLFFTYDVTLGPRLFVDGLDVTNKEVSLSVGDRVQIKTVPTDPGQRQTWTVPGDPIGGYTPTPTTFPKGEVLPAKFDTSEAVFFWPKPGTYKVDYVVRFPRKGVGRASTRFRIAPPPTSRVDVAQGRIEVVRTPGTGAWTLRYGDVDGVSGMAFTAVPGLPGAGTLQWVQLLRSDNLRFREAGKLFVCPSVLGLDNVFPYGIGARADDSPSAELKPAYSSLSIASEFEMYLVWQSGRALSIPVPIGSVAWSWSGIAVRDDKTGRWTLQKSTKSATPFQRSDRYPVWQDVHVNGAGARCREVK